MRWLLLLAVLVGCKSHDRAVPVAELVQTCTQGGDLGCPRPILHVRDLQASRRYYHDKLGFRLDWTDGDPPDFAAVTRGETQLFMCQRCQGNPGSWLWVATPDVDRLHVELVERGARIQAPPANKPWGVREMQVVDPDGNVLRIASPLEE